MTLILAALFVYRLTRLVVSDTITEPLRNRLLARWPSDDTEFTDEWVEGEPPTTRYGAPVAWLDPVWIPLEPHWFGQLITCPWCASIWVGALVTVGLWAVDAATLGWWGWVMLPFVFSAITGLLTAQE